MLEIGTIFKYKRSVNPGINYTVERFRKSNNILSITYRANDHRVYKEMVYFDDFMARINILNPWGSTNGWWE